MVPDGEGNMHLANVREQIENAEPFNAWQSVVFRLHTRNHRAPGQIITLNNAASLTGSQWNSAHQTRIVIHGWNSNANSGVNVQIRNAYLDLNNFNVIIVDWNVLANNPNYAASRNAINDVGLVTAQFVDFLNLVGGMSFATLTISGHSLGAHAAGIVGKQVTRGRVANIVGMDAALPLFSMGQPTQRLASTDANYVESIHTNIGQLGFDQPLGVAAFYPSWGRAQPGCGLDLIGTCAHSRAHEFFAESIRTNLFWATRCSGWAAIQNSNCPSTGPSMQMGGEPVNQGANGVYFLLTNANPPRAQGWRN